MASRVSFENQTDIGAYVNLTNKYCIIAEGASEAFTSAFEEELGAHMPVIQASIGNSKQVGILSAGNSKGLLLHPDATEMELKTLRDSLPDSVKIQKLDEKLSALGNVIACNDYVALLHPDIDKDAEEVIKDVLGVEVYKTTIAS